MSASAHFAKAAALVIAVSAAYFSLSRPEPAVARPLGQAEPDYVAFTRSMDGTRPDGALHEDREGQLVVDAELGHLFDYYLAGLGEKDLNAIRSEIERELERRLKPGPAAKAKRLLGSYLDYKRALVDLEKGMLPEADLAKSARARASAVKQLRPRYFTDSESAGLFGSSDAYDADALARIEVMQDKALSVVQRAEKLTQLDKRLSPALREDREAPARVLKMEESVQQMRAQGASDDEVYRMRATAFSPEAANRLAELDRDEASWKSRIASYLGQRGKLAEPALQQLRDSLFSAEEQRRLPAYE
jgi:lipase chaperone LimK